MRIAESSVTELGGGRFHVSFTVEQGPVDEGARPIGSGPAPTGAVPDRIVHALIQAPEHSLSLSELHQIVDGNPGTISRQAWTLATNAPDLQIRLKGWVCSPERGRYALTPEAVKKLGMANS
jgi:hypothetical protein